MSEIEAKKIGGKNICDTTARNLIASISLGIDETDGKIYIYVDGVKQGDGIEAGGTGEITYPVTANVKGTRVTVGNVATSVDRGGNVSVSYTVPTGWVVDVSATMRGNAITVPSGNPIVFQNVTGALVINISAKLSQLALTDIVEWYRTPVQNALTYIDGLGSGYVHYVISTDHHIGLLNQLHSAAIVNYLMQTGKFDKSLILGDIVEGGYVTDSSYLSAKEINWDGSNGDTLFVRGNHDTYLDLPTVLDDFMSNIDVTWDSNHRNFYYDNTSAGIRFIGLQCSMFDYTWLSDVINSLPATYVYFIITHYVNLSEAAGVEMTMSDDSMLNVLKAHQDKMFGGFIMGHRHWYYQTKLEGNAWITLLNCDKMDNAHTGVARTAETVSEHCVTLMSINKSTKTVKFYAIGAVLWRDFINNTYVDSTPTQWQYTYEALHFPASDDDEWVDGLAYNLKWTVGKRYSTYDNGVIETNSNFAITDLVYCEGAGCIRLNNKSYNSRNCFFDANLNPISGITRTEYGNNTVIEVPSNAVYWGGSYTAGAYTSYVATPYTEVQIS